MRICYFLSGHFGKEAGAGLTLWCMAERIARRHEVEVYANTWSPDVPERVKMRRLPLLWDSLGTAGLFIPYRQLSIFVRVSRLCRELEGKFDVLHIYNGLAASRALFVTQLMCQKAVFRERAKESVMGFLSQKTPKHLLLLFLEWVVYGRRLYRKIVPASEFEKGQILDHYPIPPDDIVPVHGGVDFDYYNPTDREEVRRRMRDELGVFPREKLLLFVGFDFRRKGFEYVLRAMPEIAKEARLAAIGGVRNLPYYMNLAEKLGVGDRVLFAGPLYGDIRPYFFASDLFVFPTLFDPFGTVVLEAMASGLPVVTSRKVGSAELVTDGEEGFLLSDPRNASEIAGKVNAALESGRAGRMGRRARERSRSCTWAEKAKEMVRFYEKECA